MSLALHSDENHLFRCNLLFCFKLAESAAEAHRQLEKAYGDKAPSLSTYKKWFHRFKEGDESIDDKPCGRKWPQCFDEKIAESEKYSSKRLQSTSQWIFASTVTNSA